MQGTSYRPIVERKMAVNNGDRQLELRSIANGGRRYDLCGLQMEENGGDNTKNIFYQIVERRMLVNIGDRKLELGLQAVQEFGHNYRQLELCSSLLKLGKNHFLMT